MSKWTVERVAKAMGAGEQFVREALKQGKLPFGVAIKFESGKWRYVIFPEKAEEYLGGKGRENK